MDAELRRTIEGNLALKLDEELLRERARAPLTTIRASQIGHRCLTYHVLSRLKSDLAKPWPLSAKKRFHVGKALERPNIRLMQDAGIKVVENEETRYWHHENISGTKDASIIIAELDDRPRTLEQKTAADNSYQAVLKMRDEEGSFRPMLDYKYTYLRAYPGQLQAYMLIHNTPEAIWFWFNKETGDYFWWLIELDYDYADSLLKRARDIEQYVAAKRIPEPQRIEECAGCPFESTHCFLGKDFGPGYDILLDPAELQEWEGRVDRLKAIESFADEYEALDKRIKAHFRGRTIVLGKWILESKAQKRTNYNIPPDVKAQFAEEGTGWRMSIRLLQPQA